MRRDFHLRLTPLMGGHKASLLVLVQRKAVTADLVVPAFTET
jgi:hypothetical protein